MSALLKQGVNPNEKHDSISVLYRAAELGNTPVVHLLLDSGACIEIGDKYRWTPLHIACHRGRKEVVQVLIARGADVNATTSKCAHDQERPSGLWKGHAWCGTTLHLATMGGHSDIVEILFQNNIDCHANSEPPANEHSRKQFRLPDGAGPTALNIALEHGTFYGRQCDALGPERLRIAQLLVNAGLMVQGKLRWFTLGEMLCFKDFPDLWDALVAGDSKDEQIPQKSD